jgi:hypothetical protein
MPKRGGPSPSYWRFQACVVLIGAVAGLVTGHYYVMLLAFVVAAYLYKQALDKQRSP